MLWDKHCRLVVCSGAAGYRERSPSHPFFWTPAPAAHNELSSLWIRLITTCIKSSCTGVHAEDFFPSLQTNLANYLILLLFFLLFHSFLWVSLSGSKDEIIAVDSCTCLILSPTNTSPVFFEIKATTDCGQRKEREIERERGDGRKERKEERKEGPSPNTCWGLSGCQ